MLQYGRFLYRLLLLIQNSILCFCDRIMSESSNTDEVKIIAKECEGSEDVPVTQPATTNQQAAHKDDHVAPANHSPATAGAAKTVKRTRAALEETDTGEAEPANKRIAKDLPTNHKAAVVSQSDQSAQSSIATGQSASLNVAAHYNAVPEKGLADRTQSRIFYLRNFNNWVKNDVWKQMADTWPQGRGQHLNILDLCCGKGGDLLKWKKADEQHCFKQKRLTINKVVFSDIAEVSLQQAESRYQNDRWRKFDAEFVPADATRESISSKLKDGPMDFDLCSQQFSLHYGFESLAQAKQMLTNACGMLRPGGYYVGTIPHADRIVALLRQAEHQGSFQNEVCSFNLYDKSVATDNKPAKLFGEKYDFELHEQVNCPEYLLHFPLLVELLNELDMELVSCRAFDDMLSHFRQNNEGNKLLTLMQALEPYPPAEGTELMAKSSKEYDYAEKKLKELKEDEKLDGREDNRKKLGVLSDSEWQVACLYMAFVFRRRQAADKSESEKPNTEKEEEPKADLVPLDPNSDKATSA